MEYKYEITKMITLSTAHITKETADKTAKKTTKTIGIIVNNSKGVEVYSEGEKETFFLFSLTNPFPFSFFCFT